MTDDVKDEYERQEALIATLQLLLSEQHDEVIRQIIYEAFPEKFIIFVTETRPEPGSMAGLIELDLQAGQFIKAMANGETPLGRLAQEQITDRVDSMMLRRKTLASILGIRPLNSPRKTGKR